MACYSIDETDHWNLTLWLGSVSTRPTFLSSNCLHFPSVHIHLYDTENRTQAFSPFNQKNKGPSSPSAQPQKHWQQTVAWHHQPSPQAMTDLLNRESWWLLLDYPFCWWTVQDPSNLIAIRTKCCKNYNLFKQWWSMFDRIDTQWLVRSCMSFDMFSYTMWNALHISVEHYAPSHDSHTVDW